MIRTAKEYAGRIGQRAILTVLAKALLITPSFAAESCGNIHALQSFAKAGFSDKSEPTLPESGSSSPQCSVSIELGGEKKYTCFWEFEYRADIAKVHFDQIGNTITLCLGNQTEIKSDQPVNHPDFYDLQTYQADGTTFALSIKDKAALEQTFVFLRVENEK
ncbi:MAG: hypothetical protein AAF423_07255 [Pseudomonadota bacterium]